MSISLCKNPIVIRQKNPELGPWISHALLDIYLLFLANIIICLPIVKINHQIEKVSYSCYSLIAVDSFQRKEVTLLDYIFAFLVSVLASVVGYYICKWLDGNDRQHQPNGIVHRNELENPRAGTLGFFYFQQIHILLILFIFY